MGSSSLCVVVEFAVGETLYAVGAEENFRKVAAGQRSDQPIKDGQASALWQNWPEACSENACHRSIDGVTTQSEEDPIKCKTTVAGFRSSDFVQAGEGSAWGVVKA